MRKAQGWFTGLQLERRRSRAGNDQVPRVQRGDAEVPGPASTQVVDDDYAGITFS